MHEQPHDANQPVDSRKMLAHYRGRIQSLKKKLDDYEDRCKFTHDVIGGFIQSLVSMQKEIDQFKESLPSRDHKNFNPLLNGIRHALPVLGAAKSERARNDVMNVKCHNFIIHAVKYLEGALEKTAGK